MTAVVIDPENATQVKALAKAYESVKYGIPGDTLLTVSELHMQAALHLFADGVAP